MLDFYVLHRNGHVITYTCDFQDTHYTIVFDEASHHILDIQPNTYGDTTVIRDAFLQHQQP